jgi:hypothetical protein
MVDNIHPPRYTIRLPVYVWHSFTLNPQHKQPRIRAGAAAVGAAGVAAAPAGDVGGGR